MLNDTKVRAARPRDKSYKLTDANRLFLLVTPSGGKLWRWNYTYDGKQKSMAFGAYPLVSLAEARCRRDEAYTLLCEGRDPAIVRKLRIEETIEAGRQTFERVVREWHEHARPQWAKVHAADITRSLERDVFPTTGALPIAQLTRPLVLGCCARSKPADRSKPPSASGSGFQPPSSTALPRASCSTIPPKNWAPS